MERRNISYRRYLVATLAALVGALLFLWAAPEAQGAPPRLVVDRGPAGAPYAAGELLVSLKTGTKDGVARSLANGAGAKVEKSLDGLDVLVLTFPEVKNKRAQRVREEVLEKVRKKLEKNPRVEAADYNYVIKAAYTPNDRFFKRQWGLRKTGFERAWNKSRGRGAKVAILDSGIAVKHPEFARKVGARWDFVNSNRSVEDWLGHGTHVAGIIAARTNNGRGLAGGCPGCRLIVGKVLNGDGWGTQGDLVRGLNWSAKRDVDVVNLSLAGFKNTLALRRAVNRVWNSGAVIVAAAGNEHTNRPTYPAAYGRAMAVAATTEWDWQASFSNYGDWVDISAPGGVHALGRGGGIFSTVPGGYDNWSGTSMATPHVAALAGLLASRGLNNKQIRRRIQATAVDLGPDGRDPYYGYGRINAGRAVR